MRHSWRTQIWGDKLELDRKNSLFFFFFFSFFFFFFSAGEKGICRTMAVCLPFAAMCASAEDRSRNIRGSFRGRSGNMQGTFRDRSRIVLGSF